MKCIINNVLHDELSGRLFHKFTFTVTFRPCYVVHCSKSFAP